MSSTEPPSRTSRGLSHEAKSIKDELESKGKVERVREVDADETRKRNFRKFYEDDSESEKEGASSRPSPFDLYSRKGDSDLNDVDGAKIPSPAYSAPPDLNSMDSGANEPSDEADDPLPQSDGFWQGRDEADFPPNAQGSPNRMQESGKNKKNGASSEEIPFLEVKGDKKGKTLPQGKMAADGSKEKAGAFHPLGKTDKPAKQMGHAAEKKLPSPFEEAAHLTARPLKKEEKEGRGKEFSVRSKDKEKARSEDEGSPMGAYQMPHDTQDHHEGRGEKRGKEHKMAGLEATSNTSFTGEIASFAANATTRATPYLNANTMTLFFQMVGSIYAMTGPTGVNLTEVLLSNPAFAGSKFYGSTIRIEKYATAPDSFNITLSGSDEAVVSFQENMPSLMAAFQNGNFSFKVNRLDVEYATQKPLFRRKERGEGKQDSDDFGGRR
jgi:hypothetical protein